MELLSVDLSVRRMPIAPAVVIGASVVLGWGLLALAVMAVR